MKQQMLPAVPSGPPGRTPSAPGVFVARGRGGRRPCGYNRVMFRMTAVGRELTGRSRRWYGLLVGLIAAQAVACAVGFHDPPRFDGAGYAVLAESIGRGLGYRGVDHPDAPRHA